MSQLLVKHLHMLTNAAICMIIIDTKSLKKNKQPYFSMDIMSFTTLIVVDDQVNA